MSKKSYIAGFCKAASAMNVNPEALARFAMSKAAEGEGGVMSSINNALGGALNWWNNPDNAAWRPLIGAGVGSALGTGIGAAVKGKKGLRSGAILGALGGGLAAVNWNQLAKALERMQNESKAGDQKAKAPAPTPEPDIRDQFAKALNNDTKNMAESFIARGAPEDDAWRSAISSYEGQMPASFTPQQTQQLVGTIYGEAEKRLSDDLASGQHTTLKDKIKEVLVEYGMDDRPDLVKALQF